MSRDYNDVIYSSNVKVRGSKLGIMKSRWLVLKKASSTGPLRLDVYKNEETTKEPKSIDVSSITSVSPSVRENSIDIGTNHKTFHFSFETVDSYKEWLQVLGRHHVTGLQRAILSAGVSTAQLYQCNKRQESLAEFHVYLLPSCQLSLTGECLLMLSSSNLTLADVNDNTKTLISWDLSTLRRYGRNADNFYIEAGSRSSTGEGMFVFSTTQSDVIHDKVHQATLALQIAVRIARSHQHSGTSQASSETSNSTWRST